ncbi:MAG: hypothetical protein GQ531_00865 [Sulfurovum sp.]|nr:hypothetical protein [Sulfurovum sp.]
MLRIISLILIFFTIVTSAKSETMKAMTTSLFDENLILHHELSFNDECTNGRYFYRFVFGGGQGYSLEGYYSILKDNDKRSFSYGVAKSNGGSRWELVLDDVTWKTINSLFKIYDYKSFKKEDPMGHVFDAHVYRMEICQNGKPFVYYRYSSDEPENKKSNRSESMDLIYEYRKILSKFYRKHKRNAKYINITKENKLRILEEKLEKEGKQKEAREKAHIAYVKKLQEKLWMYVKEGYTVSIGQFRDVDANIFNKKGETPLIVAVKRNNDEFVRGLGDARVDVHLKDKHGKSAFDYIKEPHNRREEIFSNRMYGALRLLEVNQIVKDKAEVVQSAYMYDNDILSITIKGAVCDDFLLPKNTECQALKAHSKHEIFKAIKAQDNALFDQLITTVDDLSIKNKSNYSLLWASIHYHDFYALERLIELGVDMNEFDQNALKTPVYWAAMINDTKLLKVLLNHGADVDSKDRFGSMALSTAMYKCNNFEAIKILLDNGANPYLKDKRGKTVFDKQPISCEKKENIVKMRQLLKGRDNKALKHKAINLNKKAKIGYEQEEELRKNKKFDKYLSTLSDINRMNSNGSTPLHIAVATKHYYAIKKLIEKGADINVLDGQNGEWTPFNYTIAINDIKALKIFLDNGADINFFHKNKSTVLNDAIRTCNVQMVKLLLDKGANPRLKDGYGGMVMNSLQKCDDVTKKEVTRLVNNVLKKGKNNTLQKVEDVEFQIATNKRKLEVKKQETKAYLNAIKTNKNPIFETIKYQKNSDFDKYMKSVENIELKNNQGKTLLYVAVEEYNYYAIKKLLQRGANMNAMREYWSFTPFTYAAARNDIKAVKMFVSRGANVNYQYEKSLTILSIAVKQCNVEMIKLLLDSGANPKLADKHNDNAITSLGHCNKRENAEIENLINSRQYKVDVFLKLRTGKSDFKGAKTLAKELIDGK